jgi:hypothetical protein
MHTRNAELLADKLEPETEHPQSVKDQLGDAIERELEESLSDPGDADGAPMFTD